MVRLTVGGAPPDGVLVIDKPVGPTSHDIVAKVRKTLGMRAVGHAGTLDPAASGVLVVAVGQGTKLVLYLTSQAKRYEATVSFGTATTTLDREGAVVASAPVPDELGLELAALSASGSGALAPLGSAIERALEGERRRREQMPPAFSALKQNGRSVHERARRGETVLLSMRSVEVHDLAIVGASANALELSLSVSKGYYVRALARDLGEALHVPAHLSALRRLASGPFALDEALPSDAPREALLRAMAPLARTVERVLPTCRLTTEGAGRARQGKILGASHFATPPPAEMAAWIDEADQLVALGRAAGDDRFAVERGFSHSTSSAAI